MAKIVGLDGVNTFSSITSLIDALIERKRSFMEVYSTADLVGLEFLSDVQIKAWYRDGSRAYPQIYNLGVANPLSSLEFETAVIKLIRKIYTTIYPVSFSTNKKEIMVATVKDHRLITIIRFADNSYHWSWSDIGDLIYECNIHCADLF